jgi:hypothetical protein
VQLLTNSGLLMSLEEAERLKINCYNNDVRKGNKYRIEKQIIIMYSIVQKYLKSINSNDAKYTN